MKYSTIFDQCKVSKFHFGRTFLTEKISKNNLILPKNCELVEKVWHGLTDAADKALVRELQSVAAHRTDAVKSVLR